MANAKGFPFHWTLTLSGNAEALPTVVPENGGAIRSMHIQPDPANTHVIYIGGKNRALTSSDYGTILPIPVTVDATARPCAPYPIGDFQDGSVSIESHYVLGTAGEKLHLFGHAYL